jgi:hypothetical protein
VQLFHPTDQLLPLECRMFDDSHLNLTARATPATIANREDQCFQPIRNKEKAKQILIREQNEDI